MSHNGGWAYSSSSSSSWHGAFSTWHAQDGPSSNSKYWGEQSNSSTERDDSTWHAQDGPSSNSNHWEEQSNSNAEKEEWTDLGKDDASSVSSALATCDEPTVPWLKGPLPQVPPPPPPWSPPEGSVDGGDVELPAECTSNSSGDPRTDPDHPDGEKSITFRRHGPKSQIR